MAIDFKGLWPSAFPSYDQLFQLNKYKNGQCLNFLCSELSIETYLFSQTVIYSRKKNGSVS